MTSPGRTLGRHITFALAAKLAMLVLLYLLFFSPAHRPAVIDPAVPLGLAGSTR